MATPAAHPPMRQTCLGAFLAPTPCVRATASRVVVSASKPARAPVLLNKRQTLLHGRPTAANLRAPRRVVSKIQSPFPDLQRVGNNVAAAPAERIRSGRDTVKMAWQ